MQPQPRARVLFAVTLYNYGLDYGPVLDEASPQHPTTRKGRIRVETQTRLRDAPRRGVRSPRG